MHLHLQVPIIMCIMRDHVFTKCMNALQQVTQPIPEVAYVILSD